MRNAFCVMKIANRKRVEISEVSRPNNKLTIDFFSDVACKEPTFKFSKDFTLK